MTKEKVNILFLGGAKRVSLAEAFIESGNRLGTAVHIHSYELDKYVPIASLAKIITGLKWNDGSIYSHLRQVISENNINIVLPFVDTSTLICARLAENPGEAFFPVSGYPACDLFFDKIRADNWFVKHGVPVPGSGKFPMIAKPKNGSASKGLVTLCAVEELHHFKNQHPENDYLIQNFIDAEEYSVDAYVGRSGNPLAIVPRKRLETTSGEATKSITIRDQEIIRLSETIIRQAELRGPITLQFLRERSTGRLSVMEINPRFGGGVLTAIAAGADLTEMVLNDYFNNEATVVTSWKENLVMTRAFREFYFYADNN
jgi:carbamoyl-phosphate synthase large subunit